MAVTIAAKKKDKPTPSRGKVGKNKEPATKEYQNKHPDHNHKRNIG